MVGIFLEQRRQNRHRFVFRLLAGIVGRRRGQQRQRIKRARVNIVGILPVKLAHGIGVRLRALLKFPLAGTVEIAERRNVGAFPGRPRRRRLRLLNLLPTLSFRAFVRPAPYLVEVTHRLAPVRHRAPSVGFRDLLELPLRFLVPEVVQQRHAAIERRLHAGRARN